jgi:hypothetical protein
MQVHGGFALMAHPSKVKLEQLFPGSCCFFWEQLLPQDQTSLQEIKATSQDLSLFTHRL